ncbi:TPA: DUF596 domain-containing protein [Serratia marcescens]|nr:DUF596 domain-containing protein [Serratia marcescens]
MKITAEEFLEYKNALEGHSMNAIWHVTLPECYGEEPSFSQRKSFFFQLLQMLLEDGKIRLASHGKYLRGSTSEQISLFKHIFPKNQEEMDADAFDGFWFLTEECPGGIVWIHDSGYEDWT